MPPKQSKSLGPLAGRTLKSGSGSGAGGSSGSGSGSPRSSTTPHTPPRNAPSHSHSQATPPPPPSTSTSTSAVPTPYLLPREYETPHHRTLRRLLRDVTRHRQDWEYEVIEMAEAVGLYCSALGEIEDEMRDLGLSGDKIAKGKGKQRTRASSSDEEEESGSSDDDDEDEDRSAKQKRGVPQQPHPRSTSTLLSALRDLDDRYHLIETGRKRVLKEEAALVKLKDELRELRNEWTRRAGAGAGAGASEGGVQGVQWGQRTGDEFEEAAAMLITQVQLQTAQLMSTLDTLYVTCSPLGSLHLMACSPQQQEDSAKGTSALHEMEKYNINKASAKRKEILLIWRDWPYVERGDGQEGFTWWKDVWAKEVGRWAE